MLRDADLFNCFVSYARKDNPGPWSSRFMAELLAGHPRFSGDGFA